MVEEKGIVFSIQRFSIQDGPGIRSTVFFKGCPLTCKWCSNPESQLSLPELMFRHQNCERCYSCKDVCNQNAIDILEKRIVINRNLCNNCMECIDTCYSGALEKTGNPMSMDEVLNEVYRDELFYKNSGGGVTLSGGEPLLQAEFVTELLKQLKRRSIDTTIDTCGHFACDVLESIIPYTDRILFDLKHLDSQLHYRETGVSNQLILANLDHLLKDGRTEVWIRIPVVSGFNNDPGYFYQVRDFLKGRKITKVSLLAYHEWGASKYKYLGREYHWSCLGTRNPENLEEYKNILKNGGLNVTIGF